MGHPLGSFFAVDRAVNMSQSNDNRDESWGGKGSKNGTEDRPEGESRERDNSYEGPAGMDPDGVIESNWDKTVDNFDEMKLKEKLLRGIYAYGFERPSAIQQRAILPCILGHDVIAQAQSGTGKTATFAISLLQQIDIELNECQALVLAPTRELAQQIQKVVLALETTWMRSAMPVLVAPMFVKISASFRMEYMLWLEPQV